MSKQTAATVTFLQTREEKKLQASFQMRMATYSSPDAGAGGEMPMSGNFKAMDAVRSPILITRDSLT